MVDPHNVPESITYVSQADKKKISVLIADDHALVAEALRLVLLAESDFTVTLSENLPATFEALQAENVGFDIVMLDVSMPGMNGLQSVADVIEAAGEAAVVIFSGTADDAFIWRAIEKGAKGFISKNQPFKSFSSTLRLIADGNEYVPMSLSRRAADSHASPLRIDDRERMILNAVSEGKTNKEIAMQLDTTEVAIKMKMRAICSKLEAKNRTHAVMVARQKALI